jgi:TonB family protein
MTFLVDFGIKSAVALAVAFLVGAALKRGSASVRYAMWTCALGALLVLPVASWIGPQWKVDRTAWSRGTISGSATVMETREDVSAVVDGARAGHSSSWPISPITIWIAGAIAMLARVGAGHWRVRLLFGKAETIREPGWLAVAGEASASIGFRRAVILKKSTATDVPLSYGVIRATVLLPGESEHWTEERRRVVLSHEMIHARRLDSLWGLLAQCALAVNWFNPLAWLAVRQFRKEQERSCDDAVIGAGTTNTVYAAHLVDLARSIAIPEAALGIAERFDLEGRVHALLDPTRNRSAAGRVRCTALLAATLALILPLAAIRAQSAAKPEGLSIPAAVESPVPDSKEDVAVIKPARRAVARPHPAPASAPEPEPQAAPLSSVTGTVYDPSGAVIPNARIMLKGTQQIALTRQDGSYALTGVPSGEYLIRVTAPGFAIYEKTLSFEAGASAKMDLHLAIGEVEETLFITSKRPEGAQASSVASRPIKVGGAVQQLRLIKKVNPVYPPDARAEGVEGTILLRAIVSKSGSLLNIVPASSGADPRLVNAAKDAVSQWLYEPTHLNGEPVEVITTITVSFRLND